MSKYKYYLKKPKREITKDILVGVATAGVVAVAATSPFFIINVLRVLWKEKDRSRYKRKDIYNTFYRLRKQGFLNMEEDRHGQLYISLTDKGRAKAIWYQINNLSIKVPKKWDTYWRVIIFDIKDKHRVKREALRGLLKRLGLVQLQKSVWIYPYDCRDEIDLLRDFFGLDAQELRLITARDIGDDAFLKNHFQLLQLR